MWPKSFKNQKTSAGKLSVLQLTRLRRATNSVEYDPVCFLEPSEIIPSSLHIIMGLFFGLFKKLKQYVELCDQKYPEQNFMEKLSQKLVSCGAYEATWFQTFSG